MNWWSRLNTLACEPENVSRSRPVAREPVLARLTAKFHGLASLTTMRASMRSASSASFSAICTCLPWLSLAIAVCTASVLKFGAVPSLSSGRLARMFPSPYALSPSTVILPSTNFTTCSFTASATDCGGNTTRCSAYPRALRAASSAAVAFCSVSIDASARRNGASTRVVSSPDSGLSPVTSKPRIANTGLAGALISGSAAPGAGVAVWAAAGPCIPTSTSTLSAAGVLNNVARIMGVRAFIGTGSSAG